MTKLIIKYIDSHGQYKISDPFEPKDLAAVMKRIKHDNPNRPKHLTLTFVMPVNANHI